jgi:hypothetical protein
MTAALRAVWSNKTLWVIHVFANAALFAAIYGWLWIPDRTVLDLILSAVTGVSIVLLASWRRFDGFLFSRCGCWCLVLR